MSALQTSTRCLQPLQISYLQSDTQSIACTKHVDSARPFIQSAASPSLVQEVCDEILKRHALALELLHPLLSAVLRHVALVVLVEGAAEELPALVTLRLRVVVGARID